LHSFTVMLITSAIGRSRSSSECFGIRCQTSQCSSCCCPRFQYSNPRSLVLQLWLTGVRFGGQAVSLAVNYTHAKEFRAADYAPFKLDGTEYGEVREYGNFSFTRIYEVS
jgi:hypothetical protein